MSDNTKKSKVHYDLRKIETYIRTQEYPADVDTKGKKANYRRAAKKFNVVNGLFCKDDRIVIIEENVQLDIIRDVHQGLGDDVRAKALSGHSGRIATYEKIVKRFYWYTIYEDVDNFIKSCDDCQKQGTIAKNNNTKLHPVPVPGNVMIQIGVDLCTLPEVDGLSCLVVAIDYFSKWSEAKPLAGKHALPVAEFLYQLICRHGCFQTQINDQGREFVNEVATALHDMTGVEQRITSAYHQQANGLVERQNRTIKNTLIKVLNENVNEWPTVIEGVLFAHRVSRHRSTNYSPFFLLYNRHPVLPIDVKYKDSTSTLSHDEEFGYKMFHDVLKSANTMRKKIHEDASVNIKKAQERQKRDYDQRHKSNRTIKIDDKVLVLNDKRQDRKGGKFSYRWIGPYIVKNISPKGVVILQNKNGVPLKKKCNVCKLKPYMDEENPAVEADHSTNEAIDRGDNGPKKAKLDVPDYEVEDEKPAFREDADVDTTEAQDARNREKTLSVTWDLLPNEIVQEILLQSIRSSCQTYHNILNTCLRFRNLVKEPGKKELPQVHINEYKVVRNSSSNYEMIKISVRKLLKTYGRQSGIALRISEIIYHKNWKSAWLILIPDTNSRYIVYRFY